MTNPIAQSVYTRGSGTTSTGPLITLIWDRAPTTTDTQYQPTQRILDSSNEYAEYFLQGFIASNGVITANWILLADAGDSVNSLTGNSGGAVFVDANDNINTVGTGSITVVGDPPTNTLTTQLTGLTNHNVLLGAGTATITKVAPSATVGIPLVSAGAASDPVFGTATVPGGGTGNTTFTAYSVITAGTTATGAFQNVSGLGSLGQVLTSSGAAALPVWGNGGSLVLIQSQAASSSAAINFTTGITTLYNSYIVIISNFVPSNDGEDLLMQVSVDGGNSYINTGYQSGVNTFPFNSTTYTNGNTTSALMIADTVSSNGTPEGNFFIKISNVTNAFKFNITGTGTYTMTTTGIVGAQLVGAYDTNAMINAFRFIMTAGAIITGGFTLYGIREG